MISQLSAAVGILLLAPHHKTLSGPKQTLRPAFACMCTRFWGRKIFSYATIQRLCINLRFSGRLSRHLVEGVVHPDATSLQTRTGASPLTSSIQKMEYIRTMPGYTAGEIRGLLAGLRAKLGPGSAAPTDLELQIMAHQIMVYYHHWDMLEDQTKLDLDYAYYFWEQKAFEAGPAEHLRQVAAELTAKQLACSR